MADGDPLTYHKVTEAEFDALPGLAEDAIYFIRTAGGMRMVVTTDVAADPIDLDFPRDALQLTFGSIGKPAAGVEFGRYLVGETLDVSAALSLAVAEVAATAQSDVLIRRGVEVVARFRWSSGAVQAALTVFVPTVDRGDLLIFTAPEVQDATLSGISGTFALLRRT